MKALHQTTSLPSEWPVFFFPWHGSLATKPNIDESPPFTSNPASCARTSLVHCMSILEHAGPRGGSWELRRARAELAEKWPSILSAAFSPRHLPLGQETRLTPRDGDGWGPEGPWAVSARMGDIIKVIFLPSTCRKCDKHDPFQSVIFHKEMK